VRQGSSTEKTQISPSWIWSRAAISFGQLFFSDLFLKILKWSSLLLGDIDGVLFDPLGMLKEKPFQFSESNLGAVEELRHLPSHS